MATNIFLGYPPENIKKFIIEHYKKEPEIIDPEINKSVFIYKDGTRVEKDLSGYVYASNAGLSNAYNIVYMKLGNTVTSFSNSGFLSNNNIYGSGRKYYSEMLSVIYPTNISTTFECTDFIKLKTIYIPDSCKNIGAMDFMGCTSLTSVTGGENLEFADYWAFRYCDKLKYDTTRIPHTNMIGGLIMGYNSSYSSWDAQLSNCSGINDDAFNGCKFIRSATISDKCKAIGKQAFMNSSLEQITLPNTINTLREYIFKESNLKSINIPKNIINIENGAFSSCKKLSSINIPDSISSIGGSVFASCSSLLSAKLSKNVIKPSSMFYGCTSLSDVYVPDTVVEFGTNMFSDCTSLTSVNTTNISAIGNNVFKNCIKLQSVNLSNVKSIGNSAFNNCSSLTSIDLSNIESIGDNAFNGCISLSNIYNISPNLTSIGSNAFNGIPAKIYDTTTIPGVKLFNGFVFGVDPDNILSSITFDNPIAKSINKSAFANNKDITDITFNSNIDIGSSAFSNISSLSAITINNNISVNFTGSNTFNMCSALYNVDIPSDHSNITFNSNIFSTFAPKMKFKNQTMNTINEWFTSNYFGDGVEWITIYDENGEWIDEYELYWKTEIECSDGTLSAEAILDEEYWEYIWNITLPN